MGVETQRFKGVESLADLNLSASPQDGDSLLFDSASGLWVPGPAKNPREDRKSGRWYCYTDNRWVTDSDDNYGTSYYQFNESGGTGTDPLAEWEHMGELVKPGTHIKGLTIVGRVNNVEVTDMEICAILRTPNPITRWDTGLDGDGEDTDVVVHRDFFHTPAVGAANTGVINDRHARQIDLDVDVTELSYLSLYMRPVGTITATRYFTTTRLWEFD